jgi:hypothetical protein
VFELDELRLNHYPELRRVALGAFVRRLLGEIGYEPDRVDGAAIIAGDRYSQVCTASSQRLFMFGLWSKGVSYGHGKTDSPRAMVDAIAAFVFERKSVHVMADRIPFVELTSAARAHERGELVEHRWAEYLAWDAETLVKRALLPIVQQASYRSKLRRLFPFVDLCSLHLSRTTGYPYRAIDAWAAPVTRDDGSALGNRLVPGRYEVFVGKPNGARSLGEGDAAWAAETLERAVPDDTGPAVDGTADT